MYSIHSRRFCKECGNVTHISKPIINIRSMSALVIGVAMTIMVILILALATRPY